MKFKERIADVVFLLYISFITTVAPALIIIDYINDVSGNGYSAVESAKLVFLVIVNCTTLGAFLLITVCFVKTIRHERLKSESINKYLNRK